MNTINNPIEISNNSSNVFVRGNGNLLVDCHIDTVPIGDKNKWQHNPFGEITKDKL